ncbi:MAG: heme-binding domain-containing protein [Flavobacteriales bacterium]|nr:heme-binding domain-containing protein [Bacteroidota bacterium]MCB9239609.1 heme-binding domain-containing protein [Flavobacteriales bacterium]
MKRKILIGLALVFVVIQFIRIDKTNPEDKPGSRDILAFYPDSDTIGHLLKVACYDCHSNHTNYPWYSNIAPVSWWLQEHIEDGRKHLNFSDWSEYPDRKANHKLEECIEMVQEGEMPLTSYTIAHGEARLNEEDKARLIRWFKRHMSTHARETEDHD